MAKRVVWPAPIVARMTLIGLNLFHMTSIINYYYIIAFAVVLKLKNNHHTMSIHFCIFLLNCFSM